jgi:putative tricarboxylic transport membrane protein
VVPLTQKNRDVASSLVCIGIGILFCIGSVKYGDIRAPFPSAGFFPFIAGAIFVFLALIQLIGVFTAGRAKEYKGEDFFPEQYSVKRLLITLAILFLYAVALEYLGFSITNFLFMVVLLRALEPQGWKTVLVTAFLTSVSCYLLFDLLLNIPLPRGIFGI